MCISFCAPHPLLKGTVEGLLGLLNENEKSLLNPKPATENVMVFRSSPGEAEKERWLQINFY